MMSRLSCAGLGVSASLRRRTQTALKCGAGNGLGKTWRPRRAAPSWLAAARTRMRQNLPFSSCPRTGNYQVDHHRIELSSSCHCHRQWWSLVTVDTPVTPRPTTRPCSAQCQWLGLPRASGAIRRHGRTLGLASGLLQAESVPNNPAWDYSRLSQCQITQSNLKKLKSLLSPSRNCRRRPCCWGVTAG